MKITSKYLDFIREKKENEILDNILENHLYLSDNFRDMLLLNKDSEMSEYLLDHENKKLSSEKDYTFLDILDDGETISYTTMDSAMIKLKMEQDNEEKNAERVLNIIKHSEENEKPIPKQILRNWQEDPVEHIVFDPNKKSKTSLKKFMKKFFKKQGFSDRYKEEDYDKYSDDFKSKNTHIEIIKGEDIVKIYDDSCYFKGPSKNKPIGELAASCMKGKTEYLDMYIENPNVCNAIVLYRGEGITGRALLWKLDFAEDSEGNKLDIEYMTDRIYGSYPIDNKIIEDYAISKGWAIKGVSSANEEHIDIIKHNNKTISGVKMGVKLDKGGEYDFYPYLDTFSLYSFDDGMLYNTSKDKLLQHNWEDFFVGKKYNFNKLFLDLRTSTNEPTYVALPGYKYANICDKPGVYKEEDTTPVVYIDDDGRTIRGISIKSEAINSVESFTIENGVIELNSIKNRHYRDVKSYKDFKNEKWFNQLPNYIKSRFQSGEIGGIYYPEGDEDEVIITDYNSDDILVDLSKEVFEVTMNDFDIKYLTKTDAKVLNLEILSKLTFMSLFDYYAKLGKDNSLMLLDKYINYTNTSLRYDIEESIDSIKMIFKIK